MLLTLFVNFPLTSTYRLPKVSAMTVLLHTPGPRISVNLYFDRVRSVNLN